MKQKRLLIAALSIGLLVFVWLSTTIWAGYSTQRSLDKQYQWLSGQAYFTIKDRQYQRGWFSSTESATLSINPEIYRLALERKDTPLPKLEVVFTHHIQHGPFPSLKAFSLRPAKAIVTTEFTFSEETQKYLTLFWGKQQPIEVINRIGFSDSGSIQLTIPKFDYEEPLAGIQSKWSGLNAEIQYSDEFKHIVIQAEAPEFTLNIRDKAELTVKGLRADFKHSEGAVGLMLGDSTVSLDQFTFKQVDDAPIDIALENLAYHGKLSENGEFIDGSAVLQLNKLLLNQTAYGPAVLELEANHLHAATLAKINTEFEKLQKSALNREELAKATLEMAHQFGMPLLTNDPHFAVRKLEVKLPKGEIRFAAGLGLKNFQATDLDNPVEFVNKLSANADFSLPRHVVDSVIKWQAQRMFGGADSNVSSAEIDNLAEQFIEGQIGRLSEQNLIRTEGDILSAKAVLDQGRFTLNDIPVPLPWQEEGQQSVSP